ncbi:MAG: DUF2087 domain-containing protein [Acidimicrobiia bacterium]|nr:DUF2087 domain-containing protein [Acidimicrobiia bacterium]
MSLTSRKLTGLLADDNRRRVVAAMILGAAELDEIVSIAAIRERDAVVSLERLTQAGLVEVADDGSYLLLEQAFQAAARAEAHPSPASQFPDRPPKQQKVLDRAFRDGRLIRLPVKHTHRLVVLDELVQRFEPGEKYTERQVNALLSASDIDVATLRRNLVDHGMLDRADGSYWRSGGTFAIE